MKSKVLSSKYHVDGENGFLCRYVRSDTEYFVTHSHDYFEIFMVVKGPVCHIINSRQQILNEGSLLFIRDFDIHQYEHANDGYFEFLNLALSRELLFSVFNYLGSDFPADKFLNAEIPPMVILPLKEKERLFFALTEIDQNHNKPAARLKIRHILTDLFVRCFLEYTDKSVYIPPWLEITYEKMKNPKNFIAGVNRMYEISGKTREHLTRSLKIYYNITPTEFVNDLKLEYCANLLLTSNLPIVDVCYNCGFDNLSWFYKIFREKYGDTPSKYRKKHEDGK